jgi:hypothetical protein
LSSLLRLLLKLIFLFSCVFGFFLISPSLTSAFLGFNGHFHLLNLAPLKNFLMWVFAALNFFLESFPR